MSQQIENRIQQISDEISTWLTTVEEKVAQELTDEQSWETFWSYWLAANSLRERHSACYVELNSLIYDQETNSKVGKTGPTSNAIKLAAEWTEARLRSVRATLSKDSERKNQSQASPAEPSLELEQLLPLSPRLKEALHSLCKGERIIRHQLLSLPIEVYDQEALLKQINLLDHRLIRNNLDTQLTDLEEARRALDLVHSTRFVKRLFAAIEGLSGGFQADLVSETFSIGEVSWYQRALKVAKVEESYGEVYRDGLKREVEAYSLRAEEMCARLEDLIASSSEASKILDLNEVFAQAWRSLLWGGELLITLNASPVENIDDLITECRSVRASIRDKILESEKLLDDRQYEDIFTELTWELFYYSSDLLSEIDHSAISSSIFRLECVSQDLNWFLEDDRVQKTLKAKNKSQHLIAIKRIEKQRSWVRVELQEKRLQAKLEQTFGQRRVRHFEQLIFVLIFVVLGLLLVELFWVPETDHETRKVLALIDTAICFIFLTEFIVKISLATERLFYFKRRWFIDLLPSIPFVLFTDFLLIDHMVAMRSVRLVYVSRISRYIRIVRPFIRIIRLVSFSLRGLDRLVRRYSQWINHNLVFFEPSQSIHHRPVETELEKATSAYADSLSLSRQLTAQLKTSELASLLPVYVYTLQFSLRDTIGPMNQTLDERVSAVQKTRELPVEHAIHKLVHLQGAELEAKLGYAFPKRLYAFVGLIDLPIIRSLPVLNYILTKRRNSTTSEFAAWWIRGVGKFLETLMSLGYWFADLYGVVTGPKLIDRVGNTLVRSFERPAKRLLIFGGLLLTLRLMVSGLGISVLENFVTTLQRFVGLPMIVIGSICFAPLLLGRWMKKIADQAEELFRLTSEAQFINLLKDLKEERAHEDLEILYERVILPEELIRGFDRSPEEVKKRKHRFINLTSDKIKRPLDLYGDQDCEIISGEFTCDDLSSPAAFHSATEQQPDLSPSGDLFWIDRKLYLLYRDYLDGALLHSTDIKTTEQLLGNLSMKSLFEYKLNLTPSEKKQIERLDLGSHRSIIGPYMWFSLITQSVSQASAQLVIDYNRFALPLNQRAYAPPQSLALFEDWLTFKRGGEMTLEELEERKVGLPPFNTTDINILQVLASKSAFEEEIKQRFGGEILEFLERDQRHLIRGIFSSYPLHQLPKPLRTLNPYQLYNEFIQGSKIFYLPFRILGLVFKMLGLGVQWTKEKIDEIRFPEKNRAELVPQKDFLVAARKIDRMRKPIFMRLLHLRAQIDYAYLGINVGEDSLEDSPSEVMRDLDLIKAIEVERLPIIELIESNQSALREFNEYLERRGMTGQGLISYLNKKHPHLHARSSEYTRALFMAYLCDFKGIQSYLQTKIKMTEFFVDSLNGFPNLPFKLHKRMLISAGRATKRLVHRGQDRERAGFDLFWKHLGFDHRSESDAETCWQRYLNEGRDLHPLLNHFAEIGLPDEAQIFSEIAQTLTLWTDELIALRSLQTLSLMDIENYRRYIWAVGSYADDAKT